MARGWWCRAGFGPLAPGANRLLLSRGQGPRWPWGLKVLLPLEAVPPGEGRMGNIDRQTDRQTDGDTEGCCLWHIFYMAMELVGLSSDASVAPPQNHSHLCGFFHVCCSSLPSHTPNTTSNTSTSLITAPIRSLVSAISCFTREKSGWELGHGSVGDESRQRGIVSGYETSRRQQAMEKGNIPGHAMENMILGTVCGAGLETETGKA